MTTLEEMARTLHDNGYLSSGMVRNWDGLPEFYKRAYRAGLLAVLEKHVGKMLAKAHAQGCAHGAYRTPADQAPVFQADEQYAARIIAQLTKQNERTG